jgi:hypothetical protein
MGILPDHAGGQSALAGGCSITGAAGMRIAVATGLPWD